MKKTLLCCAVLVLLLFSAAWAEQTTHASVVIEGSYYDRGAETLDLTGVRITRLDRLRLALCSMPYLTYVDLTDCGLSDELLGEFRELMAPRGVKIVWTLHLGKTGYSLRTDDWVFSTRHSSKDPRLEDDEVAPLRYATELRALDLGHNWITDVSFLEPMTELRVAILSDNRFSDLSYLQGKPLEYLEIFNTRVSDLSFLEGCDTLMDLNICMTRVYDLSPLYHLKNLRRLWVGNATGVTWTERQRFLSYQKDNLEAYEFWTDIPTLYGWRGDENGPGHPRYEIIKAMFHENVYYDFDTVLRPEQYVYLYKKKQSQ
ncbi:MAG: hypothetical protein IJU12_09300 [Clostridia bacterium]|nr:hypothetical protein [Clostridia bacterium]